MSYEKLETIIGDLPDYARDIKLNLSSLCSTSELNDAQLWGTMLACAIAVREPTVLAAVRGAAEEHLSAQEQAGAHAAATIMAMNNVYYRFVHLSRDERYLQMPARLRMNALRGHGVDEATFELWCLAVSALNGCGLCIESHKKTVIEKGLSDEQVLSAVRIAANIHALAVVKS